MVFVHIHITFSLDALVHYYRNLSVRLDLTLTPTNEHRLQTEPFNIKVTAPKGAVAGEGVVSTSELSATETWSPKPVDAKVGNAFARTITVHVHVAPAMLLPAPNFGNPEGFAIYPKSQQIQNHTECGEFIGECIDTVTYVSTLAGGCRQSGAGNAICFDQSFYQTGNGCKVMDRVVYFDGNAGGCSTVRGSAGEAQLAGMACPLRDE